MTKDRVLNVTERSRQIRSRMTRCGRIMRAALHRARRRMRQPLRPLLESLDRRRALLWHRAYYGHHRVLIRIARHGASAAPVLLLLLIGITAFGIPLLQGSLESLFATQERLQG